MKPGSVVVDLAAEAGGWINSWNHGKKYSQAISKPLGLVKCTEMTEGSSISDTRIYHRGESILIPQCYYQTGR